MHLNTLTFNQVVRGSNPRTLSGRDIGTQILKGRLGDTTDNLQAAVDGENEEWIQMYARMAKEAREEGFEDLAVKFENVAKVEAAHEKRYLKILNTLKKELTFKGNAPLGWKCRQCGYIHEGEEAPEVCPTCGYPKAYLERKVENY